MLYKFKSQATGDLIMLEPNGRQMLALIGKGDADNLIKGILEPADMPAAMASLQRAISQEDEALKAANTLDAKEPGKADSGPAAAVSLGQRASPLLNMMQRCLAQDTPIVWGV